MAAVTLPLQFFCVPPAMVQIVADCSIDELVPQLKVPVVPKVVLSDQSVTAQVLPAPGAAESATETVQSCNACAVDQK